VTVGLDVDMDERLIRVQPHTGAHPFSIKNDRKRNIPMADELFALLSEHMAAGFAPGRYLLRPEGRDAPYSLSRLIRHTDAAFTAAGIAYGRDSEHGRTAHTCRHTFATWMLLRGVPLHVVADLMGDSPKTVLATYAHLLPIDREGAIKVLDEAART
jgi:integrase